MVQAGRQAGRVFRRAEDVLSKVRLGRVPFLVAALLIGLTFLLTTIYAPSYVVSVDGVPVGAVHEKSDFENAIQRVEARASDILGAEYTFDGQVDYTFALTEKTAFPSISSFETYLFDQIGEVMKSCVLTVDGQVVGAAASEAELQALLDRVAEPYLTENTTSYSFVEAVSLKWDYVSTDVLQDLEGIYAALTANTNGETTYTVQKGDTFMAIAYANDMSMADLEKLNPDVTPDKLQIGQVLNVRETVPFLSVTTTENVTYTEEIACPVEEREDASMYEGDTKTLVEGVPGSKEVTADVVYLNGVEQSRAVVSETVLSQPTTTVVAVGTKERPKTMPTGSFQWPITGRINSYFGYRSIFGGSSFHSGLDIDASYGAAIAAADGGTVTYSGWKSGYGYVVIIDHGNGVQTYYAHNSSLVVSAGEKVYKGQTIARAGSTGRSTGVHCHFEVRINGTAVNPLSYLP